MITEYNGIPLAPDSSLQTSRGGLFDEYTRETDESEGRKMDVTEANSIRLLAGDVCILNRHPFIGIKATICLVRGSMVSVDLGYGYARPWFHVKDIIPALLHHESVLERPRTGSDYEPHMKINGGRVAYL